MTSGLQSRNDAFRLDPPIYYPPTLPNQGNPREDGLRGYPFYKPPTFKIVVPRERAPEPISDEPKAEAAADEAALAEVEAEDTVETQVLGPLPDIQLSDRIHIVGFDLHAKLMAHALAAVPDVPRPTMLTRHKISIQNWGVEGRAVKIYDSEGNLLSTRNVPCPEFLDHNEILTGMGYHGILRREIGQPPSLENVIISIAPSAAYRAIHSLRHYIDRRTTLCLHQPGLGLMEMLNDNVFTDPSLRPNYVFCHSGHKLEKHSTCVYSVKHIPGKLLLYAVPRGGDPDMNLRTSQFYGSQHTQHMIDLLSSANELRTTVPEWHVFLRRKLPGMIFQSLADTISVILGCRFDQIRRDRYAVRLWNDMLTETIEIVTSFPEFSDHPDILGYFHGGSFQRQLARKLEQQGSHYSQWISLVRRGNITPIDFFNGYFVRRAKELGVAHEQNRLAISLVKARVTNRYRELSLDVPLGLTPRMDDTDLIGGGQEGDNDPNLKVDF
ncbi:hypothetical protein GGS26DRAFT_551800 [Hypomontagnella submonticulosa]|nr:hypothetical protein GGS26DRAFT_551800 [Hypomontagnella submonticulosa]